LRLSALISIEDFAVIRFNFELETAFINIRIFDTRGRLIRFLANGEPVAHQGHFIWDGKDDQGRMARIGAYICLVQALNSNRRVGIELKKVIILVKQ
jgi:flagellar hook assembly protein FlgD